MTAKQKFLTVFTLGILCLGAGAILQTLEGNYVLAAQMIILAAILDGFDGTLARAIGGASDFGERLDSYVDTVSFGVAPAMLSYQVMWRDYGYWGIAAALAIVISGVLRFTRGCSLHSPSAKHVFRGLPIPVCASWIATFVVIAERELLDTPAFTVPKAVLAVVFWVPALAFLVLQVSNVPYFKPSKERLGISMAITVAAMVVTGHPAASFYVCMMLTLATYAVAGLVAARHHVTAAEDEEEDVPVVH